MPNSFGKVFKVTTFGESHGPAMGAVVDGLPGNMKIDFAQIQHDLDRRRPGQSAFTSPRQEQDIVECLSGVENGRTLGGPVTLMVRNKNIRSEDYRDVQTVFRPGHADYTMLTKYGITATSGGGRASARETVARVAGGSLALQLLRAYCPDLTMAAWVQAVKDIQIPQDFSQPVTRELVDRSPVRCPDPPTSAAIEALILATQKNGDSVGGVIRCVVGGLPVGLGCPVFDKLEADLAKAMLSIPACKGFEIGSGFAGTRLFGSENNDPLAMDQGAVRHRSNHSGGVDGGISNGETIEFNVAFKPVSTIFKNQMTIDRNQNEINFKPSAGRHDACVLPRAVPIVEAMTAIVLADHYLRLVATKSFMNS